MLQVTENSRNTEKEIKSRKLWKRKWRKKSRKLEVPKTNKLENENKKGEQKIKKSREI